MANTSLLGSYSGQDNSALMFRNRIINGDMRIDQRNAGAAVTPANASYTLDRFVCNLSQASKYSVQQSLIAPSSFSNSMLFTSLSAYSVLAADNFQFEQRIEGFNFSDMAWGTSNAQTITLSFWVRSSLTGTFGGSLRNSAGDRSYPFSYSISAANTWEQKAITILGDTTGTWIGGTTGVGLRVGFGLGVGSNFSGTAGSWSGSNLLSATGATSVVGTNGATFYITGVQLEAGPVATPFERRPIGTELALCQRYYTQVGTTVGISTELGRILINPPNVPMRITPAISIDRVYNGESGVTLGTNVAVTSNTGGSGYTATGYGNLVWRSAETVRYNAEL